MPKISCHLWAFLMAIQFYLTDVGRTAALNATLVGLDLQIKHIAVGSGQYNAATAAPTKTALTTELERYLVNGGEIEPTTHTLRFTVSLNSSITADIYEIGLFDENNVLFAVASSTTTPLIQLINEVNSIITFGFTLTDVDNITLLLDVNSPLAVTLMNQHTAHAHPHAQYKRINDDTERLKVANGTDPKDAVNKGQLDAESTARSNADTNLQNSKAALNGDNTQRFKVASAIYADEAITKLQLDNGLSSTFGMLNLANKADINGNLAQVFSVAAAVSDDHAVRKSQLDTKANKNGNIAEYFNVAPATLDSHAVTKTQLDSATSGLSIDLSGKANKNGDANNVFSVGAATGADHAVRKSQLDEKAELNGDSNEYFSVKDGIDDDHAVTVAQLNAVSGGTSIDLSNKADLAGSSTQQFSVADGSTQYHAVNKGQLDAVASSMTTNLSVLNLLYPVGIVIEFSVNTNPNTIFTGTTWDRFAGGKVTVGFLSGDADFGTLSQTGGQKNHTMTADNLIAHQHQAHDNTVLINLQSLPFTHQYDGTSYNHYFSSESPSDAMSHPAGQANPDPIPTLPPYVVTAKWVRTT